MFLLSLFLNFIFVRYGDHPAYYRGPQRGNLPVYYVYDSYHTNAKEWASVFSSNGKLSLRGSKYDGIFLSLLVDQSHYSLVKNGGFDGVII